MTSLDASADIMLLLMFQFYVWAIAGIYIFGQNDPGHFGTLSVAMISLMRTATLSGWQELLYINLYGCDVFSNGVYTARTHDGECPGFMTTVIAAGCAFIQLPKLPPLLCPPTISASASKLGVLQKSTYAPTPASHSANTVARVDWLSRPGAQTHKPPTGPMRSRAQRPH